jgi:hypothetical protein
MTLNAFNKTATTNSQKPPVELPNTPDLGSNTKPLKPLIKVTMA